MISKVEDKMVAGRRKKSSDQLPAKLMSDKNKSIECNERDGQMTKAQWSQKYVLRIYTALYEVKKGTLNVKTPSNSSGIVLGTYV